MDIDLLVKLGQRRWSLDILAAFDRGVPGRQAALLTATGAGRTAFAQSLAHLVELGLVERNPGHGHPLRPEFRLTEAGRPVAAMARRVLQASPRRDERELLRRAWTLPVLAVAPAPTSFTALRHRLASVTDRALSISLKNLEEQDWLTRSIDASARPPRPLYTAKERGAEIGGLVRAA